MASVPGFLLNLEYGVGTSTTATVGKVNGGQWGPHSSGKSFDYAISGVSAEKYGMVVAGGNATFWPTAVGILASASRATITSSAMPALTFQGGNSREAWKHATAYIDSLDLECAAPDGKVSANLTWVATTPSNIAVPTWQAAATGSEFHWFQGVCTIDGAAYGMQSFKASLKNNLTPYSSLDSKSAGSARLPEGFNIGNEEVTAQAVVMVPPTTSGLSEAWADVPDATVEMSLAFTNAASTTMTLALANLTLTDWNFNYVDSAGNSVYTIDYIGKPNTANTWALS
jgi:hypothetical protein